MNVYTLDIILNHSILIAAVAGMVRARNILKTYYPFLFFIWLALVNETVSLFLIRYGMSNMINSNLYVLFEYLLLLYQFYKWRGYRVTTLYFFIWAGVAVWITDNVIINQLSDPNSFFRSYASLVLLLFSIDKMNSLIINEKGNLLRNAVFLTCTAFLLFYGCKLFVEVFHLFKAPLSNIFYDYLWMTLSVVNGISNIIYAIAVICIPTREEFILHY